MIIPEKWRNIYAELKAALRAEEDRGARERLRRVIAAVETGAADRRAREIARRQQRER